MHAAKTILILGMSYVAGVYGAACDPETATPSLQSRSLRMAQRSTEPDAEVVKRFDTITSVNLNSESTEDTTAVDANDVILLAGAQRTCQNCAKIKTAKAKFNGYCLPSRSKGWSSSHNCNGKSYLCVQNGVATCYTKSVIANLNAEGGECFL
jgi:hypothetical protein